MLRTNPCFRSFAPMPPFLVIPILLGSSVRQLSPSYWPNPISNNRAWAASSLFLSWDTQIKRKNTLIHTQQDRDLQILLVWARATSQPLNQQVKVLSIRSSFGLLRPSFVESKTRTELFDGESSPLHFQAVVPVGSYWLLKRSLWDPIPVNGNFKSKICLSYHEQALMKLEFQCGTLLIPSFRCIDQCLFSQG
jgi:hypothetical protein